METELNFGYSLSTLPVVLLTVLVGLGTAQVTPAPEGDPGITGIEKYTLHHMMNIRHARAEFV